MSIFKRVCSVWMVLLFASSAWAGFDMFGHCGRAGQRPCFWFHACDRGFEWDTPTLFWLGTGLCQPKCSPAAAVSADAPLDVTFGVATDLHFGKDEPNYEEVLSPHDAETHVAQINQVFSGSSRWPQGLADSGQVIAAPAGVVLTGDLTHAASPRSLMELQDLWEPGRKPSGIKHSVYVGLGNHDFMENMLIPGFNAGRMKAYVKKRMKGCAGVVNFHKSTANYSWDWGKLHLIQAHTYADERKYGSRGGLAWLARDLARHVGDSGRPVIIFQHYGFDDFSKSGDWWQDLDRENFLNVIRPYNVIALFSGHRHWQDIYSFGIDNFVGSKGGAHPNANGVATGPSSGGFYAVHVTQRYLDVAFYSWTQSGLGPADLQPDPNASKTKQIVVP